MDKLLHFLAGFLIASMPINPVTARDVAIGAGIAKEVRDSRGYGTAEAMDAFATAWGAQTAYELRTGKERKKPNFRIILPDGSIIK